MSAIDTIKEMFVKGEIEINERVYKLSPFSHQKRVQIMAFYSSIQKELEQNNLSFMAKEEFTKIWKDIENLITYEGVQLSKRPQHWEEFAEDYIQLIILSMPVICYPFLKGLNIS